MSEDSTSKSSIGGFDDDGATILSMHRIEEEPQSHPMQFIREEYCTHFTKDEDYGVWT